MCFGNVHARTEMIHQFLFLNYTFIIFGNTSLNVPLHTVVCVFCFLSTHCTKQYTFMPDFMKLTLNMNVTNMDNMFRMNRFLHFYTWLYF
jgi:hypothetical protein